MVETYISMDRETYEDSDASFINASIQTLVSVSTLLYGKLVWDKESKKEGGRERRREQGRN